MRRARTWALCLGALVAAGLVGWRLHQHLGGPPAEPTIAWLVDAEAELGPEGAHFAFTVDEPVTITIDVHLPAGTESEATLARLLPAMRPGLVYVEEPVARYTLEGPHAVEGADLARPGTYVFRIPPVPMAMGDETPRVHLLVHVPPR